MGLWLLANTAGYEAADLRLTDGWGTDITGSEENGLQNVRGGHRGLKFKKTETTAREIIYVNKSGLSAPTHIVVTDAESLDGLWMVVDGYESYPTLRLTSDHLVTFSETLVGIDGTDWCRAISFNNSYEAVGLWFRTVSTATVGKVYFSAGLEFTAATQPIFSKVPVWAPAERHGQHAYKLHAKARITLQNVSREMLNDYFALPKDDPIFLYDDTGGDTYGNRIPEKLWHCLILAEQVQQRFDDLYAISLELGILKHGSGGW